MVETVYDLRQPSMFTTTFSAKPPSPLAIYRCLTPSMKVLKTQSDPNPSYFSMGSAAEDV